MRFPSLRSTALGIAVAGALVLVACSGGGSSESPEPTDTPPEPSATLPPDNGGGGELFDGVEVGAFFAQNCASCHGADRQGVPGLGLPLLPEVLTEPDGFYFDTIKNGRAGTVMPQWGTLGLSDDEITALVAFIRTAP
jgi:mono/diheme cytochrome c family protein